MGRERSTREPAAHAAFCAIRSKYNTFKKSLGPIRKGKAQSNYFNYSSLRSFRRSAQQMLQSPSSLLLQGLQTFKSQAHPFICGGNSRGSFPLCFFSLFLRLLCLRDAHTTHSLRNGNSLQSASAAGSGPGSRDCGYLGAVTSPSFWLCSFGPFLATEDAGSPVHSSQV